MNRVQFVVQFYDLDYARLKQFIHVRDLVEILQNVFHGPWQGTIRQEDEGISFTGGIRFSSEERLD